MADRDVWSFHKADEGFSSSLFMLPDVTNTVTDAASVDYVSRIIMNDNELFTYITSLAILGVFFRRIFFFRYCGLHPHHLEPLTWN